MLLPWLDLIIEAVGVFHSLMGLLYVTNSKMPSWRYVEERVLHLIYFQMIGTVHPVVRQM
jgi:hypothetical protein